MKRALEDRGDGPWADANALPESTDYGQLAKLWAPKRQLLVPSAPAVARGAKAGSRFPVGEPQASAEPRATRMKRLEWKALNLLH